MTRNRADYPTPGAALSRDDVREGIQRAGDVVDMAANVLPSCQSSSADPGLGRNSAVTIGDDALRRGLAAGSVPAVATT